MFDDGDNLITAEEWDKKATAIEKKVKSEIEKERKGASKANIKNIKNITGPNVKEKVVAIETPKK